MQGAERSNRSLKNCIGSQIDISCIKQIHDYKCLDLACVLGDCPKTLLPRTRQIRGVCIAYLQGDFLSSLIGWSDPITPKKNDGGCADATLRKITPPQKPSFLFSILSKTRHLPRCLGLQLSVPSLLLSLVTVFFRNSDLISKTCSQLAAQGKLACSRIFRRFLS